MFLKIALKKLKKLLIDKEIDTISELAELTGVGRDTCSGILNGKIRPSTAVMEKFMNALEMTPTEAGTIFFKP